MYFHRSDAATTEQRFMAKVDQTGDCWLWLAATNPKGYGYFELEGRNRSAHRVAYEMFVGPIPPGLQLDHLCRNRGCVNPEHLEPVTCAENVQRSMAAAAAAGEPWRKYRKTHCKYGHEFTEENTHIDKHGHRWCRPCRRRRLKDHYRRNVKGRKAT